MSSHWTFLPICRGAHYSLILWVFKCNCGIYYSRHGLILLTLDWYRILRWFEASYCTSWGIYGHLIVVLRLIHKFHCSWSRSIRFPWLRRRASHYSHKIIFIVAQMAIIRIFIHMDILTQIWDSIWHWIHII